MNALKKFPIRARIWRSIGIFVVGFIVSTIVVQVQGLQQEKSTRTNLKLLFPAAQAAQSAEALFLNCQREFNDAVLIEDQLTLERGLALGKLAATELGNVSALTDLPARSVQAAKLASSTHLYLLKASEGYSQVIRDPINLYASGFQLRMHQLADEGSQLQISFRQVKDQAAEDLRAKLSEDLTSSRRVRWITLLLFAATAGIAFLIVNLTIRRVVINPILKMNAELEDEKQRADEASRTKSEFLANMSHEIRTPINGIMGMTQILMDTKIDADQRDCLETIRYSSDVLLGLINGILDLSKIEARKLELEDISYDLNSLIENAVEMLAAKAEEKSIRLYSLIDANVPLILKGDPQRVRQVLVNLVSNAVKFTEFGEVAVHARVLAAKDGRASMIRCEVRDSGAGISPDVQARLFKPFEQADGSTTRRFGGTGLGLSISKRLIELMGGVIGLLSKPGAGSTFWFEIPFREGHLAAVDNRGSVAGKRVLIVDDEPLERTILRRQLERHGLLLDEAAGPRQALAQLRSRQLEGLPFDFALVDYKMPDMDGIDLGRQVRNDPGLNATRLILITSLRDRKVGRDAITAGFHAYLSKPLKVSQLVETMQGSLRPPADLGVPENTNDEKIGGRILVAEDSAVNQKVMMKVLTKLGYKPEMVNNGRSAMEAALSNKYSAILMDCQMPEMDGYEATAEIRRRETEGQRVPIIALTANAMKGDSDRCFEAGMDDYISKPVDLAVLAQVLQRWTDVSKNTRQPELQPSSDAG